MSEAVQAVELRDGSLRFDAGGPPPVVLKGYARDPMDPWRLNLEVKPGPCEQRRADACRTGLPRWFCVRRAVPVNPGVCCRCQGKL